MLATNQRSETRYHCVVPVESKEGLEFDDTKTLDISLNGIGLVSSHPIALNRRIALEIVLKPNTQPIIAVGVVKWVRKMDGGDQYRVGMILSEVVSGSGARLNKYLTSRGWENT